MIVICSYCGSECGEREQADGRCGSCACFFTGNEQTVSQVADESVASAIASSPEGAGHLTTDRDAAGSDLPKTESPLYRDAPAIPESSDPATPPSSAERGNEDEAALPSGFDPTAIENDGGGSRESEGLIQPRKLSPQFRRRVERTWQSTLSDETSSAEHTLSSTEPNTETKQESPTLSIATREISGVTDGADGASASDYQLNNVIGEGSMGRVWSARQNSLARNVAVKVPRPELASSGSVGESQFISEVVVTGQLEHPNIVPIYELGRDPTGVPFYSMKHVQGRPWNEFIDDNALLENLEIFMKVCDAIAFAHDRNFLHRDIKPHNVMVGEFGEVSVMDWGIAVSIKKDPDQPWASVATGPAGTPAYMAPEMAAHNPSELGVVSDVYLLGAVLYEMVTGTPPHPKTGSTADALLAAAANEITPTKRVGELVDIARRAMATNTNDRYQSVKALQDALREYQSHRESIKLSESADEHCAQAIEQGSSDEYARARFAFEEALRLWEGNSAAKEGLRLATMAHANNALVQENFEMGIGILDPENAEHKELLGKLESRQAAQRRLAWVSKLAAAVAVIAILSVAVVTISSNRKLADTNLDLETERDTAREQREVAIEARTAADNEKTKAEEAESRAKTAKDAALEAKVVARGMERTARMEKWRAEEAAYSSDIALAAESIQRNQFNKASATLQRMDPLSTGMQGNVMAPLRHIEWGLLTRAAHPNAVQDLLANAQVESVASSDDGKTIGVGTGDGTVRIWDASGQELPQTPRRVLRYGEQVSAVAVSRDGQFVAAAGRRATEPLNRDSFAICVWDLSGDSEEPVAVMRGHTALVHSLAFSDDGDKLVSSGSDRMALAWDRVSGNTISVMRDHLDRNVWSACFSPDALSVATACDDGRVRVWSLSEGSDEAKKSHDLRGHEGPVYTVAFGVDGRSVYSGGYDQRILRWDLNLTGGDSTKERFAALESRLEGSADESRDYIEIGTKQQRHESSIRSISVKVSSGRERLLSSGNDNTIRIWEPKTDRWSLAKILRGHGRWVRSATFTRNGQSVLSGAHDGAKLWAWNNYSMPRVLTPNTEGRLGNQPSELGLSAATVTRRSRDSRWVATAFAGGTVSVWDMLSSDQTEGQTLVGGHALLTARGTFFDEGRGLMTSAGDNTTRLWDSRRGTPLQTLMGTGYRGVAAVSPRSSETVSLVTGSDSRLAPATMWIVRRGKVLHRIPLLENEATERLKQQLGRNNSDSSMRGVFQFAGLKESDYKRIRQLTRMIPEVTAIAFSEDGSQFAIGDADGHCFLFASGDQSGKPKRLAGYRAHGESVTAIEFLPDGLSLLTASSDGQIRHWDSTHGSQLGELPWSGPVTAMQLSPDGDSLLVGHAPMMGRDNPIVQRFSVDGKTITLEGQLTTADPAKARDWTDNEPTVQSVQFAPDGKRALISLFFPTRRTDGTMAIPGTGRLTGYQLGYWDLSSNSRHFQTIKGAGEGEIASARLRQTTEGTELLVIGGKGARLWKADSPTAEKFTSLKASFRPASSITAIDFSYDPKSGVSERLVVGDSDGNVRIFVLNEGRWSESTGAAAQLTGHHQTGLVSTLFHPIEMNQLVTADSSGIWHQWTYDQQWAIRQTENASPDEAVCYFAEFSPEGDRLMVGTDRNALLWQRRPDGDFERTLQGWVTGPAKVATFSKDGSWMVTGDGERPIDFWNPRGDLIAQIPAEDAKGLTSMDLSHDRRRFVTGQNERIVIWDTSRIIEDADSIGTNPVKQLLTLEEHRRVSSVSIAPDGINLLSAGTEGKTIIWQGKAIAPIAVSFAGGQLDYRRDASPIRFDDKAMVSDPSHLASFKNAELNAMIDGTRRDGEQLRFIESALDSGVGLEISGAELRYRPHEDAEATQIGSIDHATEPQQLTVRLNEEASDESIQLLIRSLAYEMKTVARKPTPVSLSAAESTEVAAVINRNVTIRLSGMSYHERPEDRELREELSEQQRKTLYPESIEMSISIEVELPDQSIDPVTPEPVDQIASQIN